MQCGRRRSLLCRRGRLHRAKRVVQDGSKVVGQVLEIVRIGGTAPADVTNTADTADIADIADATNTADTADTADIADVTNTAAIAL